MNNSNLISRLEGLILAPGQSYDDLKRACHALRKQDLDAEQEFWERALCAALAGGVWGVLESADQMVKLRAERIDRMRQP